MKAICVTAERGLELRDIPEPRDPPPGHLVVRIEAAAINPGDKALLKQPGIAGPSAGARAHDVWGASAAGTVVAAGTGVPEGTVGRRVAIYRSLGRGPDTLGLWCERAQVPHTACLRLPEGVQAADYSGSLVNIITAHAFLDELAAQGGGGVLVTAGTSATGRALAVLAQARGVPTLRLVRTEAARAELDAQGLGPALAVDRQEGWEEGWEAVRRDAEALGVTAVFDGVGGSLVSRLLPALPPGTTVHAYGFLAGQEPVSFPTSLLVARNLTFRRFSNFESATVRDRGALEAALRSLEAQASHPLLATRIGQRFPFEQVEAAMAYDGRQGRKAVLEP